MPKNLIIAASLPATPETLFDMYLDPAAHAAFTGTPVTIEPRPGSPFRAPLTAAFPERCSISNSKRLIVQTWRSIKSFRTRTSTSVLVLTFWPEEQGARIELVQVNVADRDFAGVSHGWEKYYWTPWRAYLQEGSRHP